METVYQAKNKKRTLYKIISKKKISIKMGKRKKWNFFSTLIYGRCSNICFILNVPVVIFSRKQQVTQDVFNNLFGTVQHTGGSRADGAILRGSWVSHKERWWNRQKSEEQNERQQANSRAWSCTRPRHRRPLKSLQKDASVVKVRIGCDSSVGLNGREPLTLAGGGSVLFIWEACRRFSCSSAQTSGASSCSRPAGWGWRRRSAAANTRTQHVSNNAKICHHPTGATQGLESTAVRILILHLRAEMRARRC